MKIFTQLADIGEISNAKVALGAFDGIHLGHQKIIRRAVEAAKSDSGTSAVFTFSNHPLSVIDSKRCPLQIVSNEDKEKLIACLGVDVLCNVPFNKELFHMSAVEFVNLLRQKCRLTHVVIGNNYTYGYQVTGTAATLKRSGEEHGFSVEVMDLVTINIPEGREKISVSSSIVREFIKEGKVNAASFLLGRFFSLSGKVINGDRRGRVLGYPTANISLTPGLVTPADGVYAVSVSAGESEYDGVANIGANPTFAGSERRNRRLEVHILNFDGDLYGKELTVSFLEYIRREETFSGIEQLKLQMDKDVQAARAKLKTLRDKSPRVLANC